MSFDEWIISVFDCPIIDPMSQSSPPYWYGPDATILAYMTRLFTDAETILASYSDAQAAQGLWAMCNNYDSQYPDVLTAISLPFQDRLDCVNAMDALFRRFFARRCTADMSDTEPGKLDGVCYMWWDVMPLSGLSKTEWLAMQGTILSVLRHCLTSESVPCQKSAWLGWMYCSLHFETTSEYLEVEELVRNLSSTD